MVDEVGPSSRRRSVWKVRLSAFSLIVALLWCLSLAAQTNTGEIRLKVTDPTGLGLKSTVEMVSEANQLRQRLWTDEAGNLLARRLPFGVYAIHVEHEGFAPFSGSLEIRS